MKETLPAGWTLQGLPESLVLEFEKVAQLVITTRFVPMLWLRAAKRRSRLDFRFVVPTSLSSFKWTESGSPLLQRWNAANPQLLKTTLQERSQRKRFRRGDILFHLEEPVASLVVLLSGSCDLLRRPSLGAVSSSSTGSSAPSLGHHHCYYIRHEKRRKGISQMVKTGEIEGLAAVADYSLLNQEPFIYAYTATSDGEYLTVEREPLLKAMETLPLPALQPILTESFECRRRNLPTCFPMTATRLRMSSLFRTISENAAAALIDGMVPRIIPKDRVMIEKGAPSSVMFFIRRGIVRLKANPQERPQGKGQTPTSSSLSEEAKAVTLREGATLGEREMMFNDRHVHTVVAETNVDLYVLSKKVLDEVVSVHEGMLEAIQETANEQRAGELQASVKRPVGRGSGESILAKHIANIPLLRLFTDHESFGDLVSELESVAQPRVFGARHVIVSYTDNANRLLLLTRGSAAVRQTSTSSGKGQFAVGEWIGYTCLLAHRWQHTFVAVEPAELWEITQDDYYTLLKKHNLYKFVLGATQQLLQPLRVAPHRHSALDGFVHRLPNPNSFPDLDTPNMHPVSVKEGPTAVYCVWQPPMQVTLAGYGRDAVLQKRAQQGKGIPSKKADGAEPAAATVTVISPPERKDSKKHQREGWKEKKETTADNQQPAAFQAAFKARKRSGDEKTATFFEIDHSTPASSTPFVATPAPKGPSPPPAPSTKAKELKEQHTQKQQEERGRRPVSARTYTQRLHPGAPRYQLPTMSTQQQGSLLEQARRVFPGMHWGFELSPVFWIEPRPPIRPASARSNGRPGTASSQRTTSRASARGPTTVHPRTRLPQAATRPHTARSAARH